MKAFQSLRTLARNLVAKRDAGPAEPVAESVADEYDDLLASLGATPPDTDESSALALKDAMIAELQESLVLLQPLGEELGACERARLEAVRESEELRAELAALRAAPARDTGALEREKRKYARQKKRLQSARTKLEERSRVAAERWHEIRSLRGERNRLERELTAARKAARTPPSGDRAGLSDLMNSAPTAANQNFGARLEIRASSPADAAADKLT